MTTTKKSEIAPEKLGGAEYFRFPGDPPLATDWEQRRRPLWNFDADAYRRDFDRVQAELKKQGNHGGTSEEVAIALNLTTAQVIAIFGGEEQAPPRLPGQMDVYGDNPRGAKLTEWYDQITGRIPADRLAGAWIECVTDDDGTPVINVAYAGEDDEPLNPAIVSELAERLRPWRAGLHGSTGEQRGVANAELRVFIAEVWERHGIDASAPITNRYNKAALSLVQAEA